MSQLASTTVRRGGSTARNWYETIKEVNVAPAEELRITFSMPSKGGGQTDVQLEIRPADFPSILEAMCAVDKQATLEAMSIEFARQLASQSARYHAFERQGELRVLGAAHRKYRSKPKGQNEKEKMIWMAVNDIVCPPDSAQ